MAPIGRRYASLVAVLTRLCVQRAGEKAVVWVQSPVVLHPRSVPQPDVALLAPSADDYRESHPTAADVLLAVEVSDTTLGFDLDRKVPLYARYGVPEVWIVEVVAIAIRIYRQPDATDGYQEMHTACSGERIASLMLPEVFMTMPELFPDRRIAP